MRSRVIIGIVLFLISDRSESATRVSCDRIEEDEWGFGKTSDGFSEYYQRLTTCEPNIEEVDDKDFTISPPSGQTIEAIHFQCYGRGVRFLPTNLFSDFSDLILIRFYNCPVTSIDENHFQNFSKLRKLDLSYCKIQNVASNAFADLISLEELHLNSNKIQFLDEKTFASLKALRIFAVGDNQIKFLDENVFSSLTNLEIIDLNYNKLKRLPRFLFKNNLKLKEVDLEGNELKCIDSNLFDHLSKLETVDCEECFCLNSNYKAERISKSYLAESFDTMKRDLTANCTCSDTSGVSTQSLGLIVQGQKFPHGN